MQKSKDSLKACFENINIKACTFPGQKPEDDLDDIPEVDMVSEKDKLSVSMKGEKISTTSVLDSEESLEDDTELLEMTLDDNDRSDLVPLFINFTCTIKNKLEHSSVSVESVTSCLCKLCLQIRVCI